MGLLELLEPCPHEPAWNTNKKLRGTTEQFKVKGLYDQIGGMKKLILVLTN